MKRNICILSIVVILWPYVVGFTTDGPDSSATSVEIGVGTGSYSHVSRDCSGMVTGVTDVPYSDAGVSVDHRFRNTRMHVGARAGVFSQSVVPHQGGGGMYYSQANDPDFQVDGTARYFNPNFGVEYPYVGVNFGVLFFDQSRGSINNRSVPYKSQHDNLQQPTWKLRIGYLDSWYFMTSYYSNVPIVTGGGLFDMGLGFSQGDPNNCLFLGLGAVPYDSPVLSLKYDHLIQDHIGLGIRASAHTGDATEYGLGLTTKFIW